MNSIPAWLVVLGAATAHADSALPPAQPDRAAIDAADANLESTWRRTGTSVTFAFGAGLTVGFGIEDAVGGGGSASLRLRHAASENALITAELAAVAVVRPVDRMDPAAKRKRNEDSNVLFGVTYYVNRALWIRGALGFGVYKRQQVGVDGTAGRNVLLVGPAAVFGTGLDLVRWRRFDLGLELMSISMANRDGVLSSGGFMLGVSLN